MRHLSISRAWDETREIILRDGRLFISVALALVTLPSVVVGIINPRGMANANSPGWTVGLSLIATIVTLAGQLGIMRLALAPSITVGGAIAHGFRRMPIYLLAAILIVLVFFIAAIPFALVLTAMGVPLSNRGATATVPPNPATIIAMLIYVAVMIFIGVRMMMSGPVATAEPVGPIGLLKRSWDLTAGNFWRLLGFLAIFLIATGVVLLGIGAALGVVTTMLLGPIQPLSLAALVTALVQALLSAAITIFFAVMLARIYAQLSGRAEETGEIFR